ncbi:MAG: hypothetical protein IKL06_03195 [Lachnospiraceae bacterium]|nr:hypothetical protein [Lachnospiraceae bacterium]
MKIVKSISLFFVSSLFGLVVGVFLGVRLDGLYEKGEFPWPETSSQQILVEKSDFTLGNEQNLTVSGNEQRINADTVLVVKEKNLLNNNINESVRKFSAKYLGMNRMNFEASMKTYEQSPPLSEKEKGFVSLEIETFSKEKVVLQMNYRKTDASSTFYLGVQNHEVVVFMEDMETVYLSTGIILQELPLELQMEIMGLKPIKNEEELYGFLENFSS